MLNSIIRSTAIDKSPSIPPPPPLVWLTLLTLLALTALLWNQASKDINTSAQLAFQQHAERSANAVRERMHDYENVLRGGVSLFNSLDKVSRKEWQTYVAGLELSDNFPGIQGMGFAKYIRPAELESHIRHIRSEGFTDYSVKPPGPRSEYTSIIYLEPFNARNKRAFGFDMFSEAIRHEAMTHARDTGKAAITGKVILKQETQEDTQSGFLMYLPLYKKNAKLASAEQRAQALLGYIYSAFRMNDLMAGILGKEDHLLDADLEIYDGETVSSTTLMYDDDKIMHGKNEKKHRLMSIVQPVYFADHVWTLAVTSTSVFEARIDHTKPMIVALAGIVISFLFFVVTWSLATNRARALQLADHMTHELRRQEALNHAIVDEAADGIITINEAGAVMSFNSTAVKMFGYSADEVLGNNVKMLMPEPYHSAHDGYLTNYMTTGHKTIIGIGREVSGRRKNGLIFPMDLAVSEVDQGGGARLFAGIVRDISERKKAEENLRLSEERFQLALRGANDGLWDWDIQHKVSYHSPRWNSMFGYPEQETLVSSEDWLKNIHGADVERVKAEVNDYLEGRTKRYQTEYRMKHKEGHFVWILSRGIAKFDTKGKPYRMVGIYSDISKQKEMDALKNEFVSTVSHELRTPLTSIRGSLGLVAGGVTGELPDQAKTMVDLAYKNTERLLSLINDILDIEKIQSGKMDFNLQPQELMPLIEQVIIANKGYAEQYQVKFELLSSLPGFKVNIDGDRLVQVMSNLLSNAAKFSHAGGKVEVTVIRQDNQVRVAFRDYGQGISKSFHDRIFQKFSQGDSSDSRHKGGAGLGLNISKSIIEMMQGEIGFESEVGAGTVFYFVLPVWQDT